MEDIKFRIFLRWRVEEIFFYKVEIIKGYIFSVSELGKNFVIWGIESKICFGEVGFFFKNF